MIQHADHLQESDPEWPAATMRLANELASLARARRREAIEADANASNVRWLVNPQAVGDMAEVEGAPTAPQRDLQQVGALTAPAGRLLLEADEYFSRAVRRYELLNRPMYSQAPGRDVAWYTLGTLCGEFEQPEAARRAFFQLIRNYPASSYVSHAYLWFAELMFNNAEMASARQFYERVVIMGGPLAPYAHYKLAWCAINLADWQGAEGHLVAASQQPAVATTQTANAVDPSLTAEYNARVQNEALSDLAFVFANGSNRISADVAYTRLMRATEPDPTRGITGDTRPRVLARACQTAVDVAAWPFAARMCLLAAPHMEVPSAADPDSRIAAAAISRRCVVLNHARDAAQQANASASVDAEIATLRVAAQCP